MVGLEGIAVGTLVAGGVVWLGKQAVPVVLQQVFTRFERYRQEIEDWHNEVDEQLTGVLSVGVPMQTAREFSTDGVTEAREAANNLRNLVEPPPHPVKSTVDDEVLMKVARAAGMSWHLVHVTDFAEGSSVADIVDHHFEIAERLDSDLEVDIDTVMELVGTFRAPSEDLDITHDEADEMIGEFREMARREIESGRVEKVEDMRVLPWKKVDEVVSGETRKELIGYIVRESYQMCLVDAPREAKNALKESRKKDFS